MNHKTICDNDNIPMAIPDIDNIPVAIPVNDNIPMAIPDNDNIPMAIPDLPSDGSATERRKVGQHQSAAGGHPRGKTCQEIVYPVRRDIQVF